ANLGAPADDRHRRPRVLRVACGAAELSADQHRVRHHPAARASAGPPCASAESGSKGRAVGAGPGGSRRVDAGRGLRDSVVMKDQLHAFLDHLRLNENASAHTVRAYEGDLSQFVAFVAAHLDRRRSELLATDFNHLHIRAFLGDLHKRGNSRSSAARKFAAIRTFGRYLRREGAIEGDPAALVGTPKREQRLPAHLAEAEMSRLLDMPDAATPLGRRDRAIMELFYASGLRLSELVGLGLEDVNLSSRVVRVLGKGGKERIVPFNRSTEAAIRAWLNDREQVAVQGSRIGAY